MLGVVPEDDAVGNAFRQNLPVVAADSDCPASRAMQKIALKIIEAKVKPVRLLKKLERAIQRVAEEGKEYGVEGW